MLKMMVSGSLSDREASSRSTGLPSETTWRSGDPSWSHRLRHCRVSGRRSIKTIDTSLPGSRLCPVSPSIPKRGRVSRASMKLMGAPPSFEHCNLPEEFRWFLPYNLMLAREFLQSFRLSTVVRATTIR